MIVSVTSLQCYSNDDWFLDDPSSRKQIYSPQDELQAIVCDSGVNSCVQYKQVGDKTLLDHGSYEVMSFQCDNYSECFDGDGKTDIYLNLSIIVKLPIVSLQDN